MEKEGGNKSFHSAGRSAEVSLRTLLVGIVSANTAGETHLVGTVKPEAYCKELKNLKQY